MAQYDLLLTQNVHATLIEYSERFVNIAKGGLLSAITDQTPTVLAAGTDGYILARDDVEVTGLKWIDPATLAGVTVAAQADDRIVTATGTADALNAEEFLTYNTTQGLYIGSGNGILFAAAAATHQIYTPAGAVKSNITIETGTNSAAGAGDITLKAGAGIAAGGNVYFQRDTTYGNFFFGTGAAGHLPARATETQVIYYDTSTGQVSYGSPGAVGGLFTRVGTELNVTTAGDDIALLTTEKLKFNHSTTYISGPDGGTGAIHFYVNSTHFMGMSGSQIQILQPIVAQNNQNLGGTGSAQWFGTVFAGRFSFEALGYYIDTSGTDMIFTDGSNTDVTLSSLVGGGIPWTRTSTDVTLTNSGDTITLEVGELFRFGAGTDYIASTATGNITIYNGSSPAFSFQGGGTHGCYASILPIGSIQLGDNSNVWTRVVTNILNLEGTSYGIQLATNAITFTDVNGTRTLASLGTGSGTVTAVNNGDGMNFTNITTSGSVTLGTPTTNLTSTTTNAVTTSAHTHAITTGLAVNNIVAIAVACADNDYAKFTTTGLEGRTYAEVAADIDSSNFAFSGNNTVTGGYLIFNAGSSYLKMYDNLSVRFGNSNDFEMYFKSTGADLYLDGITVSNDIFFSVAEAVKFTFDMGTTGGGTGTALDWVATSDIRLKTKIRPLEVDMDQFLVISNKAIRHNWVGEPEPYTSSSIGFVAQDIEEFYPELVTIGKHKPHLRGLSYAKLVTVAIKATAQTWEYAVAIDGKLDVVQSEVEKLKIKVEKLTNELNTLKNG